jgi:hypothetical protein
LIADLEPYASLGKYVRVVGGEHSASAVLRGGGGSRHPVLAKRFQADQQAFSIRQLFVIARVMRSLGVSAAVAVLIYLFFNVVLDYVANSVPRPDNALLGVLIFPLPCGPLATSSGAV